MHSNRNTEYCIGVVKELISYPRESEWFEFKKNNSDPKEIGEYISALANSAAVTGRKSAYLIWGIDDATHSITGTTFKVSKALYGAEELESWLLRNLSPKISFRFYEFKIDDRDIVLLEIPMTFHSPVQFQGKEFIRIGSYKKPLKEHPEKERELWRVFDQTPFESCIARERASDEEVFSLLDFPAYFDLLDIPLPDGNKAILNSLELDKLIVTCDAGGWNITNLGALLFAKDINAFPTISRKAVRIIKYKGKRKTETVREKSGAKGYAVGFKGIISYIANLVPSNEEIKKYLRKEVSMYPEVSLRELVVNALIHQDFFIHGAGPMIEIFDDRIEITNPGLPLVDIERFIDSPPQSRNEILASLMRRFGICEERGSGIDRVVSETELYQLPAPIFETTGNFMRVVLFAHKDFKNMDKEDRIRACYLHACLRYVQRDFMTNGSLRERFGFSAENAAMASRIIKDTLSAGKIRCYDETVGNKAKKYLPSWV